MKITTGTLSTALCLALLFFSVPLSAQDKNVKKAEEYMEKGNNAIFAEHDEYYKKAIQYYIAGGSTREEAYGKVADAMIDKGAYQASTKYIKQSDNPADRYKRIGDIYIEKGTQSKGFTELSQYEKAMKFYDKAKAEAEGYSKIADACYQKGGDSFSIAVAYYAKAKDQEGLTKIAKDLESKGPEYYGQAAAAYRSMETEEGYKKAGDLFFKAKKYQEAYESYNEGLIVDGLTKFADFIRQQGDVDSANLIYARVSEFMLSTGDEESIRKLAAKSMQGGNYQTAVELYERLEDFKKADAARAYLAVQNGEFYEALDYAEGAGETALANTIRTNLKKLSSLDDVSASFDEIMIYAPYVETEADRQFEKEYYQEYKPDIIRGLKKLASIYSGITEPAIQRTVRERFSQYYCVKVLLDKTTFQLNKAEGDITLDDLKMLQPEPTE